MLINNKISNPHRAYEINSKNAFKNFETTAEFHKKYILFISRIKINNLIKLSIVLC